MQDHLDENDSYLSTSPFEFILNDSIGNHNYNSTTSNNTTTTTSSLSSKFTYGAKKTCFSLFSQIRNSTNSSNQLGYPMDFQAQSESYHNEIVDISDDDDNYINNHNNNNNNNNFSNNNQNNYNQHHNFYNNTYNQQQHQQQIMSYFDDEKELLNSDDEEDGDNLSDDCLSFQEINSTTSSTNGYMVHNHPFDNNSFNNKYNNNNNNNHDDEPTISVKYSFNDPHIHTNYNPSMDSDYSSPVQSIHDSINNNNNNDNNNEYNEDDNLNNSQTNNSHHNSNSFLNNLINNSTQNLIDNRMKLKTINLIDSVSNSRNEISNSVIDNQEESDESYDDDDEEEEDDEEEQIVPFNFEDYKKELKTYSQFINPPELKVNDVWYLVENDWIENWKRYISNDHIINGGRKQIKIEPIDNSSLLLNEDQTTLIPNIIKGIDFQVVSKSVWEYIFSKYGNCNTIAIPRLVSSKRLFRKYEIDFKIPMTILLIRSSNLKDVQKIYVQKTDTIDYIKNRGCKLFNISRDNIRVWDYYNLNKHCILNDSISMGESNLIESQHILFEERLNDGNYLPIRHDFHSISSFMN